jgi:hypothetical protein
LTFFVFLLETESKSTFKNLIPFYKSSFRRWERFEWWWTLSPSSKRKPIEWRPSSKLLNIL